MIIGTGVNCLTCGHRKKPRGRSAPMGMMMCDSECPGYYESPHVGQLWPNETSEDFGYPISAFGSDIYGDKA